MNDRYSGNRYPEERPSFGGITLWGLSLSFGTVVFLMVLLAGILGGGVILAKSEGWFISQHTRNIRHSIGFVDGHNRDMANLISQYHDEEAVYDANPGNTQLQQSEKTAMNDRLNQVCQLKDEISEGEQSSTVRSFLREHPCR